MHLVHNERTKLTATWFNTLATGLIAAGAFAPVAAMLIGFAALPVSPGRALTLAAACVVIGGGIHVWARVTLGSFTRMSFETFAFIWPVLSIGTVVIVISIIVHFQDRAERRNSR